MFNDLPIWGWRKLDDMKALKFTDKALADLRHSQFEFTYIAKDGSTKTHKQLDIPFSNLRHTRLRWNEGPRHC